MRHLEELERLTFLFPSLGYTTKIGFFKTVQLRIFLKYYKGNPVVNKFKLVSKPSRRVYYSLNQLWKINSGKYFLIISTNLGLKSLKDCKKCKIGGEPFVLIE